MENIKDLQAITERMHDNGFQLFKVGGCVRDKFLNRENNDIDLATDATPDQIFAMFPLAVDNGGAKFGIVIVPTESEAFEIATFRKDGTSNDHRHPDSVEFSTMEEDAFRRDFTINALYEDCFTGEILDPTGYGLDDIKSHIIAFCSKERSLGSCFIESRKRIEEDYLRVLRAFRFLSVLPDFTFDSVTEIALGDAALNKNLFKDIANERIGQELKKLIVGDNVSFSLYKMQQSGYLDLILSEISKLYNCPQDPSWHPEGTVFMHTLLTVKVCRNNMLDRMACLLHDIGKPATQTFNKSGRIINPDHENIGSEMAELILKRLRFSKEEIEIICTSIRWHMKMKYIQDLKPSEIWTVIQSPVFDHILAVAEADEKGKWTDREINTIESQLKSDKVSFMINNPVPEPVVKGDDLISIGMKPGKSFKKILDTSFHLQLDNGWTREQILKQAKSWR